MNVKVHPSVEDLEITFVVWSSLVFDSEKKRYFGVIHLHWTVASKLLKEFDWTSFIAGRKRFWLESSLVTVSGFRTSFANPN